LGFLGVDTSLTGRTWVGPTDDVRRAAEAMEQQTGLPSAALCCYGTSGCPNRGCPKIFGTAAARSIARPTGAEGHEYRRQAHRSSVRAKQKVAIFADYDVDGATSGALLITWFRHFGIDCTLYIPDRITEGYGPNAPAMSDLASQHDLIICVDCGTLSHEAIAAAESCDVIVLDHHLGGETLPDCLAVVNPNRQDENGDLAHLCAAVLCF
jgi:single-stranded-DNA-specific exonuclease